MKGMHPDEADAIYTLLVKECGANESNRDMFCYSQIEGYVSEWRFMGSLGFGGKFYRGSRDYKWYVDCYPEDQTPEREQSIQRVNDRLEEMRKVFAQV